MGIRTSNPGDPGDGGDGGVVRPESFSSHLFQSFPIWDAVDRERIGCNGTGPGVRAGADPWFPPPLDFTFG